MKRRSLVLIAVLTATLLLVMSSAVSAEPGGSGAIACDLDITYNGEFWFGAVSGDGCV